MFVGFQTEINYMCSILNKNEREEFVNSEHYNGYSVVSYYINCSEVQHFLV